MIIVLENNPDGHRARRARKWFADNGPPDLQPLPLGYEERERLKHGGADHILAWYARSLDGENYDVVRHPPFEDYACGVMASEFAPAFIKKDEQLQKRFPPRELAGMGPGLCWLRPKVYAKTMLAYRRSEARQAERDKWVKTQRLDYRPIDESVKIPEAVRRAAARADSFCQASEGANSTKELNHADASGRV
jgi:hypothetical protein